MISHRQKPHSKTILEKKLVLTNNKSYAHLLLNNTELLQCYKNISSKIYPIL